LRHLSLVLSLGICGRVVKNVSSKVRLTKEQADALERALECNEFNKSDVVDWRAKNLFSGKREPLNQLSLDTLCKALYIGYELEPTPEDMILYYYERLNKEISKCEDEVVRALMTGEKTAIHNVINFLNIKINGVNC
jgi:hypothetical protein